MTNRTSILLLLWMNQAFGSTLIVLNKSDATASLVDLKTRNVVATLPTGNGPHEVAVSPDGHTAVIANYGDKEAGHTLTLIDLAKARTIGDVDLGLYTRPHGISFTGSPNEIIVTAEDQQTVLKVDILKHKVTAAIPTEQKLSHMLVVDVQRKHAFVSNIGADIVTVLDLAQNKKMADIPTEGGPEGIDYSHLNNELWVANRSSNSLAVLDASTFKVKIVLPTGSFPIRVKFTPDDKRVLVTNAREGSLIVFDAKTKKIIRTINFPKGNMDNAGKMFGEAFKDSSVPIGIALDPKANHAFIAHASLDQISILDLEEFKLIGSITAGREPDGMAYSPIPSKK